jgi:hypothetical protein
MRHSCPKLLRLLGLLIPGLLAACSTPYRPAVVVRDSAPFPGIVNLVQNGAERPLDVILVHGMCTHDAAWANHGIDRIAGVVSANFPANVPAQAAASSNGIQLIERTQQIGGTPVRFHALVWSPLTTPLKRQLDYDNTGTPTDCSSAGNGECKPKRAWLNGYVKDQLLNDCLSDAVIYEGASGNAIRDAMVESVSRIIESNPNGDRTLAVVAESLGSKILFDAASWACRHRAAWACCSWQATSCPSSAWPSRTSNGGPTRARPARRMRCSASSNCGAASPRHRARKPLPAWQWSPSPIRTTCCPTACCRHAMRRPTWRSPTCWCRMRAPGWG